MCPLAEGTPGLSRKALGGAGGDLGVACTCRELPHCPSCNALVRMPLTYFAGAMAPTAYQRKAERAPRFVVREDLGHLSLGRGPCSNCGESMEARHERRCVSDSLKALGVPPAERERILSRVNFPE